MGCGVVEVVESAEVEWTAQMAAGEFDATQWDVPQVVSFHGHWDGDTIVVEQYFFGKVLDTRPETGYWDCGLWAGVVEAVSLADAAAKSVNEYDEASSIRWADEFDEDDWTPEDEGEDDVEDEDDVECRRDGCEVRSGGGEGFDGFCGTCADVLEGHGDAVDGHERGTRPGECEACDTGRHPWH